MSCSKCACDLFELRSWPYNVHDGKKTREIGPWLQHAWYWACSHCGQQTLMPIPVKPEPLFERYRPWRTTIEIYELVEP